MNQSFKWDGNVVAWSFNVFLNYGFIGTQKYFQKKSKDINTENSTTYLPQWEEDEQKKIVEKKKNKRKICYV